MSGNSMRRLRSVGASLQRILDGIGRAYREFLTVPSVIIILLLGAAAGTDALDRLRPAAFEAVRNFIASHIFSHPQGTQALLATIASGIITITSITISLLLIALQQAAGAMTARVFDQYLRRWYNQAFFGYFVGVSLYTLIVLGTVDPPFNPVFGGTLDLLFMIVALCLLIVLLYTTINQTRPAVVIEAVHDLTLAARKRQRSLLSATKPAPMRSEAAVSRPVTAAEDGFVTRIDVSRIGAAARRHHAEVIFRVSIGSYVAYGDTLGEVRANETAEAQAMVEVVASRTHIERQRDLHLDPAYGIAQLETIGWTSVSSAKHNPAAGLLVVVNLRDLLARWSTGAETAETRASDGFIVYEDDTLERLMDAFESLAVASSESLQHMVYSAIVQALAHTFERLRPEIRPRVEELIGRMLTVLGDHAPTAELDSALSQLSSVLTATNCIATARAVDTAHRSLERSVGTLQSRASRPQAGS